MYSRSIALALSVVGSSAIWLRGYFIPFTPYIGPYVASLLPGEPFHPATNGPEAGHSISDATSVDGPTVIEKLVAADVLEEDGGDLMLTPTFREMWQKKMNSIRERSNTEIATQMQHTFDTEISNAEVVTDWWNDTHISISTPDAGTEDLLLSRHVAIAETAAMQALEEIEPLSRDIKKRAVNPLRTLLDRCPVCGTHLEITEYPNCCGNPRTTEDTSGLVCPDCQEIIHTLE